MLRNHGSFSSEKRILSDSIDLCDQILSGTDAAVPVSFNEFEGRAGRLENHPGTCGNIIYNPKRIMLPTVDLIDCPRNEFPVDPEVPEGCAILTGTSDEPGSQVLFSVETYVERLVATGEKMPLHLHVYRPKDVPGPLPAIVYCQGSAFKKQNLFQNIVRHVLFAQRGFIVAVPEYRPSSVAPFPAQCEDFKCAVRYLRSNAEKFDLDQTRIAAWGDSSGGHTVLMAGFTGDRELNDDPYQGVSAEPSCIVDWYGPIDFSRMNAVPSSQNHFDADSPEGLEIGGKPIFENPGLVRQASPLTYLETGRKVPPTLIMHGSRDCLVPFNQSCLLYERMRETGQDVTFVRVEGAGHGALGFHCAKTVDLVESFIREHLERSHSV